MARQTLFSILLRQPWWVTLIVAFAMFAIVHAIFPPIAPFMAMPFALLAIYIAYRQWRGHTTVNAAERIADIRALAWDEFSALIADAYRHQGYKVAPAQSREYDFTLTRDGRTSLVQCRRWKVNAVGAGPVRDLAHAVARLEAYRGICIAAGGFSEPARKLTAREPVTLLSGLELVQLVAPVWKRKQKAK